MMGKYLSLANEYVQKFKPVIEEKTGTNLEEVLAKDISTKPNYIHDAYRDTRILVHRDCPNSIFVNQNKYEWEQEPLSDIPVDVAHELSHLAHNKFMDEKYKKIKSQKYRSWLKKRFWKKKSFTEGFAVYMSLNKLIDVYDDQAFKKVERDITRLSSYATFSDRSVPYERGYKFFRKVLSVIGKDKVFEVARSPPMNEVEIRIPLLYLLRYHPAKGIRNMPKFLAKSIRTKILKRLYGYAPFDF